MPHESIATNSPKPGKRGRPRAGSLPRDGSAAEKRRAQVRKAQRAYRTRRDAEKISESQRVDDLEQALLSSHSDIENLVRLAKTMGLAQEFKGFATHLQQLAEKHSAILHRLNSSRDSKEPSTHKQNELEFVFDSNSNTNSTQTHTLQLTQDDSDDLQGSVVDSQHGDSGVEELPVQPSQPRLLDVPREFSSYFPLLDSLDQSKPATLNFPDEDLSFSKQLHIRSLERGLSLATSSSTPLSILERAFPTCFPMKNKDDLIRAIKMLSDSIYTEVVFDVPDLDSGFHPYNTYDPHIKRVLFESSPWNRNPSLWSIGYSGRKVSDFLFPEEMELYLMKAGISVIPNSSFIVVMRSVAEVADTTHLRYQRNQPSTEFISLSKLYEDIMETLVCLGPAGPAFRKPGVDRIIQIFTGTEENHAC